MRTRSSNGSSLIGNISPQVKTLVRDASPEKSILAEFATRGASICSDNLSVEHRVWNPLF
jgi:hypothetical protein